MKLLTTLATLALSVSSYAGSSTNYIAIYNGTQTATIVSNQPTDPEVRSGKRTTTVYLVLDVVNHASRTITVKKSGTHKTFRVEASKFNLFFRSEDGRPRPKEYLFFGDVHSTIGDPQDLSGTFYKGAVDLATSRAAHLAYDCPRLLALTGNFAYSSGTNTVIVNARGTLNMNVSLSRASNDAHEILDQAVNRVKADLTGRGYTEELP